MHTIRCSFASGHRIPTIQAVISSHQRHSAKAKIKTSPSALRNFLTVDPAPYEGKIKSQRSSPRLVVLFSGILIDFRIELFDTAEYDLTRMDDFLHML